MTRSRAIFGLFAASLLAAAPASFAAGGVAGHVEEHAALPEIPSPRPPLVTGEVDTARFRILYTARSEGSARALAGRIEAVRDDFQKVLGRDWPGVTEIRVGLGREEMNALALPGGKPPAWAEALAYPGRNIILLDGNSLLRPEGEITLRHELSHAALGQISNAWPRWFQEGMAMYLTGDRFSVAQYTAMFRAVTQDRLLHLETLAEDWPQHPQDVEVAYAESVTYVSHLIDEYGPAKMSALLEDVKDGAPFELAFARAFKTSLRVDEDAWRKTLPGRYSWTPILTGGSALWGLTTILLVGAWLRRRRLHALKLAEMAAQEAAEDAALKLARAVQELPAGEEPAQAEELPWPVPSIASSAAEPKGEGEEDPDLDENGLPRGRVLH